MEFLGYVLYGSGARSQIPFGSNYCDVVYPVLYGITGDSLYGSGEIFRGNA